MVSMEVPHGSVNLHFKNLLGNKSQQNAFHCEQNVFRCIHIGELPTGLFQGLVRLLLNVCWVN